MSKQKRERQAVWFARALWLTFLRPHRIQEVRQEEEVNDSPLRTSIFRDMSDIEDEFESLYKYVSIGLEAAMKEHWDQRLLLHHEKRRFMEFIWAMEIHHGQGEEERPIICLSATKLALYKIHLHSSHHKTG